MTLLPEYRAQLTAVADARARRPRPARRPRLRLAGAVPILASAAVALAVAAVAIVGLGPGHGVRSRPHAAGSAPANSMGALVRTLGVLRRPQTAADRSAMRTAADGGLVPDVFGAPRSQLCQREDRLPIPCADTLDRSLVREVSAGDGYRVGLFPVRGPDPRIVMTLHGPDVFLIASGPEPATAPLLRTDGAQLSAPIGVGRQVDALLVPDGVARITLDRFRLAAPHAIALGDLGTVSAPVHGNVALLTLTGLTMRALHVDPAALGRYFSQGSGHGCAITYAAYALPATARMTWRDGAGAIVHQITVSTVLYAATDHPLAATLPPASPRWCQPR